MKINILEKSMALGLIFSILLSITDFSSKCQNINKKILRFHVLANSDSPEDQALKLKVRDRILKDTSKNLLNTANKEEAKSILKNSINEIKSSAKNEIFNNGYNYNVNVSLTNCNHFNTKDYNSITLPAGNYDALKIEIGEGKGKNFFCVLFPPMCISAATETSNVENVFNESEKELVKEKIKYRFKFKIVEWWEDVKNIFKKK
ncbi:MAG: stage II sporulation protein R [Oscillospiraceae bacterium]|jgi:stage II sporulation protein R|nr:stage II sporulation protein R [Oscillospiraceae bacterium]